MAERFEDHPYAAEFHRLTPHTVMPAVQVGGAKPTGQVSELNSYENRVYNFELDDGSEVVGKFYRPGRWSRECILEEHEFLAEAEAAGVPVACPLDLNRAGDTLSEVQGIFFALFPKIEGREPQELTNPQLETLGIWLAKLHEVGASHAAQHRPVLGLQSYLETNLQWLLDEGMLPREVEDSYEATIDALLERLDSAFDGVPVHRIHGDLHLGNILQSSIGFTLLDFDDSLTGPAIQDIWMLAPSYDDHDKERRALCAKSYATERDFDPDWLMLVEPLRALRFVHYATWLARRYQDPAFQRAFPYFGTLRYWQDEVNDLREQIARIDRLYDR